MAEEKPFEQMPLHPDLLKGIRDLGFVRPTPIQAEAIPAILAGRDVIGCAQTGTGKTAAFVLPIVHKLLEGKSGSNMRALVIAPTRELALQSMQHLQDLSRYVPVKGTAIFGGVPILPQIDALEKGVDVVSATPGRLLDHIYSGRIDFVDLKILVLDEADRMLDMGFLPDIQNILRLLPAERQNLLFSATMPPEILKLTRSFMREPVNIQIGQRSAPAAGIHQAVYPVPDRQKADLLFELLKAEQMDAVLVFTRTKRGADRLAHDLKRRGVRVSALHSDRSQAQRLYAMDRFRWGKDQVMVATDIAARGIDIEDITHVINFDVPRTPEDYIHRIGRTARAEATGDAFTLMEPSEERQVREIEQALGKQLPRVTLPGFRYEREWSGVGRDGGQAPRRGGGRHRGPRGTGGGRRSFRPRGGGSGAGRPGGGRSGRRRQRRPRRR